MNRISFLNRGYAFKGLLAVMKNYNDEKIFFDKFTAIFNTAIF